MIKLTSKDERRNLNRVRNLLFSKLMYGEKDRVMMILIGKFSRLTYEELEEVYSDGCFVLWKKMNEECCKLDDGSLMGYLVRICINIGMHYLRKVRDDVESLDLLISRSGDCVENEDGLMKMFDIIDEEEGGEKEVMKKLDNVWKELSDVDKMILECYYWDGCKMDEIAKKIGYKSADSVKSRKNKILKRMMEMMKKEEGGDLPSSSVIMEHVFCTEERARNCLAAG